MSNPSGSLGTTHLLAYVRDGESAASVRALMNRQNISDFAVEPGTVSEATEYLKNHASPQVLIVEVPSGNEAPKLLDALADVVHPSTKVIVTGTVDTFSFYHWLMGLGIHDYLLLPFNESQLASALAKGQGAATKDAAPSPQHAPKIIACIGSRGGVGTTMVATTLACILAEELSQHTALVDLDVQCGSAALALDLDPSRGLRDALEKPDRIDTLFLERVMMKASPMLSVLSAEEPFSESIPVHAEAGALLFAALREKFPFMVVDVPRQLNPLTRHVLAHADHVVLVTEPGILGLRDALRTKDLLVDTYKRAAPLLVINRDGMAPKQQPSRAEFAKHLGLSPAAYIPFHEEVIGAVARGEALHAHAKLQAVCTPLRSMARSWLGADGAEASNSKPAKRGFLKGRK